MVARSVVSVYSVQRCRFVGGGVDETTWAAHVAFVCVCISALAWRCRQGGGAGGMAHERTQPLRTNLHKVTRW